MKSSARTSDIAEVESELKGLAARIERIEAIEAIKQLKARYARACDPTHNVPLLMSMFTDDAVFDVGQQYGRYEGKQAIEQFLHGADGIIPWALHAMLSPMIEVSDDVNSAHGSWYLLEMAIMPSARTGEPEAVWIAGTYDDRFVKQQGQWKFKQITLRMQIMSPYAEGWAKTPWRQ